MLFYLFSDNICVFCMDVVLDEKLTVSLLKDARSWRAQFSGVVCSTCLDIKMFNTQHFKNDRHHELHFGNVKFGYNPFVIVINKNKFHGINIFPSSDNWDMARQFVIHENTVNISKMYNGQGCSKMKINNIQELLSLIKHTIFGIIDESSYDWIERKPYFDFLYNMTFWDAMMCSEIDEEIVVEI